VPGGVVRVELADRCEHEGLARHAEISCAFEVRSVVDVAGDAGSFVLTERVIETRYVKDYDARAGNHPTDWATLFDVTRWTLLEARIDGERVGGALVVHDTPGIDLLRGRRDLAVLWDLRVAPAVRGQGVGRALWDAVEEWARRVGCVELDVETQTINVPACRFYQRQGCVLHSIDRAAYPDLPGEVQMIWRKRLRSRRRDVSPRPARPSRMRRAP